MQEHYGSSFVKVLVAEDADEDGNLDGFVVPDKSESSESDSDDDGEPAVPVKKRPAVPVKKRTAVRK